MEPLVSLWGSFLLGLILMLIFFMQRLLIWRGTSGQPRGTPGVKSRTGDRPLGRVTTDPRILLQYMICTPCIALRNKTQKPQTVYHVQFWQPKWATKSEAIRRKPIPYPWHMFVLIQPLWVILPIHSSVCMAHFQSSVLEGTNNPDGGYLISVKTLIQILWQDTGQVHSRHKLTTGKFEEFILQLY